MARGFNRGILELARKGKLSGISVMIKRKFGQGRDLARLSSVDLGLHLELSPRTTQKEILHQLQKFKKKFKRLPDYLDGHQHCHLTPSNIEKVIAVAKKYRLPVRSRFDDDRKKFRRAGIATCDAFVSWHPSRKAKFLETMKHSQGLTEIVCHPGYFDPLSSCPYNKQRLQELKILKSKKFQNLLSSSVLLRYSEFQKTNF